MLDLNYFRLIARKFLGKSLAGAESVMVEGREGEEFLCLVRVSFAGGRSVVYYVYSSDKSLMYDSLSMKFIELPWIQSRHIYKFIEGVVSLSEDIEWLYYSLFRGVLNVKYSSSGLEESYKCAWEG